MAGDEPLSDKSTNVPATIKSNQTNNDCPKYESLDDTCKKEIIGVVHDTKELLLRYKSASYVYPNWLNITKLKRGKTKGKGNTLSTNFSEYDVDNTYECLDPSMITRDIGFFVMTRVIDSRYLDIPKYRSINNPFHRALWHIAHYMDFTKIITSDMKYYKLDNDDIHKKFFSFLDSFCMLSRVKTIDEFKTSFYRIYRNITSASPIEHNVTDPLWIYHKYCGMTIPSLYERYPQLSKLTLINKIGTNEFYNLLCREMAIVPKITQIKDIVPKTVSINDDLLDVAPAVIPSESLDSEASRFSPENRLDNTVSDNLPNILSREITEYSIKSNQPHFKNTDEDNNEWIKVSNKNKFKNYQNNKMVNSKSHGVIIDSNIKNNHHTNKNTRSIMSTADTSNNWRTR